VTVCAPPWLVAFVASVIAGPEAMRMWRRRKRRSQGAEGDEKK
jgi:hypothetical protein